MYTKVKIKVHPISETHCLYKKPVELKYRITDEAILFKGRILHRIQALKDFGDVKKGSIGGYVESIHNLSQADNAWIYDDAKVFGDAYLVGNSKIYNNSIVCGPVILNYVELYDYATINASGEVLGKIVMREHTNICGFIEVTGSIDMTGIASIKGSLQCSGKLTMNNNAQLIGDIHIPNTQIIIN